MNEFSNGNNTYNPADTIKLYAEIARKSGELLAQAAQKAAANPKQAFDDEQGIARAFFDAWVKMASDPVQLMQSQIKAWQDLHYAVAERGAGDGRPQARAGDRDTKGRSPFSATKTGRTKFLFDYLKQSYLIAARHLQQGHVLRQRAG